MERYPFTYDRSEPFMRQVGDWVADVFYDILPENGFEVRDEQIYMAFQLERAFAEKRTIFAEAGVGTGKTLVYLLYAICYARFTGKPAVIACADESLIEQLVKPEGDIAKLSKYLDLAIDARLGKSPDQYVCLAKLDEARFDDEEGELFEELYDSLPSFVRSREALQSFHAYGDRKQYPHLNDDQWRRMNWDPFQDCFVCDKRHRCGQTLSRDAYRKAGDLIICSHDFYMEHVWTYEGRKREGQLPLLPEHCAVVFDEGHLLESAAQKALTYKLKHAVFEQVMLRLVDGQVRESLALLVEEAIERSADMFEVLRSRCEDVAGSDLKQVTVDGRLLQAVGRLRDVIGQVEEDLVFESGLHTLNDYQLRIVEEHLETMQIALALFDQPDKLVCWAVESANGLELSMMPRIVKDVLRERVFASRMPVVFSSATLSVGDSFDFAAHNVGVDDFLSFSVASPYEYERQMEAVAPPLQADNGFDAKMREAVRLLTRTGGRALVLFPAKDDLQRFKQQIGLYAECAGMRFLFEGDREISDLISAFQNDEESVLCAVSLWEGLDVPGPSLSNVIIWALPYPPHDPVFAAKRRAAASPFEEVDLPYMLLRLRQGVGRLIRSRDDKGIVAILGADADKPRPVRELVAAAMPGGVPLKDRLDG